MTHRWSNTQADAFHAHYASEHGSDLAIRTYASRLIGQEPTLVLHGGGNTSVKTTMTDPFGETIPVLCVKGSGHDLARIEPEGHTALDLEALKKARSLEQLSESAMVNLLLTKRLHADAATPSIEALMHAFLPAKFIDHTHADAILALTNRPDGAEITRQALGEDVIVLDYVKPGFSLARAVAQAYDNAPESRGMVLMHHGLITWGKSAEKSYEQTVALVSRAIEHIENLTKTSLIQNRETSEARSEERYRALAPALRGALALPSESPDRPKERFILLPMTDAETLEFIHTDEAKALLTAAPLTSDHIIRTRHTALWLENPEAIEEALTHYAEQHTNYIARHAERMPPGETPRDPRPRVIAIPGIGIVCVGETVQDAAITRDIVRQTIQVKRAIAESGRYQGLSEEHLFDMEYYPQQQAKLAARTVAPLGRQVALVTGAAGAIGSGICRSLLEKGCHVAATDLPGDALKSLAKDLEKEHPGRIIGVPMDVTETKSVSWAFKEIIGTWGGLDLVVINAGLAHVSSLADMDVERFRTLERVNVDGTLLVLSETARLFKTQNSGGDVVVISTKNVFCPGASFGAYSATKAASHQLARIASLEFASMDVRVNMVSPDGVFSDGARRSGLWAEVGPDRMKARGLDEQGLETYYQNRNLLKMRVTSEHVANAVLFFATRQTPTTGATIPVDGGLPDSTPR
ncbi:MAG: bifunctional aldolase/short-chain dehydrogenase [Magnetococcales bacterium]|nr:bifunctional aldolase/short-chain dehydrogenase [Magnetococcales bacterium]